MLQQSLLHPKSDLEMVPVLVLFSELEQSMAIPNDISLLRTEEQLWQANLLSKRTVEIQERTSDPVGWNPPAVVGPFVDLRSATIPRRAPDCSDET
jgi:hypothetical protein